MCYLYSEDSIFDEGTLLSQEDMDGRDVRVESYRGGIYKQTDQQNNINIVLESNITGSRGFLIRYIPYESEIKEFAL